MTSSSPSSSQMTMRSSSLVMSSLTPRWDCDSVGVWLENWWPPSPQIWKKKKKDVYVSIHISMCMETHGDVSPQSSGSLLEDWVPEGPAQNLSCFYNYALLDRDLFLLLLSLWICETYHYCFLLFVNHYDIPLISHHYRILAWLFSISFGGVFHFDPATSIPYSPQIFLNSMPAIWF